MLRDVNRDSQHGLGEYPILILVSNRPLLKDVQMIFQRFYQQHPRKTKLLGTQIEVFVCSNRQSFLKIGVSGNGGIPPIIAIRRENLMKDTTMGTMGYTTFSDIPLFFEIYGLTTS